MQHLSERDAEVAYQDHRALRIGDVNPTPDYVFERYRTTSLWRLFTKDFMFKCMRDVGFDGKDILEVGCGEGEISTQLAKLGGRVAAVDISPELIRVATMRAHLDGVLDRIHFSVGDITESPLPKNNFDFVVCHAVLHHVDLRRVMPRLIECLKPGGMAIMVEPIAFSPFFQRCRDLLPIEKDTSPAEHQLTRADVEFISGFFDRKDVTFFDLLGRFSRLLPNANKIDKGHPLTKAALVLLNGIDRLVLTLFPPMSKFSGAVVIVGTRRSGRGASDQSVIVH